MRPIGIVRRIDHLGRVVIPKELRQALEIEAEDALEIFATDEGIFLRPYDPANPRPVPSDVIEPIKM